MKGILHCPWVIWSIGVTGMAAWKP